MLDVARFPPDEVFDAIVVGGGPAGATAADDLARDGRRVLLLDRAGRIKPCGGAIPPKLVDEFAIPQSLLVARIASARMVSPTEREVDMPIEKGYVGMVDRDSFDEWLRERAAMHGALRVRGVFEGVSYDDQGLAEVRFRPTAGRARAHEVVTHESRFAADESGLVHVRAKVVIGADGARSEVARQAVPGGSEMPFVYAYHEIVRTPPRGTAQTEPTRCDVFYDGRYSPDFYSWVFPHGELISVGSGTANRGFSIRGAVGELRERLGLAQCETVRREGAPLPLKPLKRWDDGRRIVLAGDAAGVVAPASGEGIYYAMLGGRLAAQAAAELLRTGKPAALALARKRFMKLHGRVFWVLGILQRFWYVSDRRRERFVSICRDVDVQRLTWEAYLHKRLVRSRPLAHVRIFFKDLAHLFGVVAP